MNILVPDSWLREYLKTDATPKELKEYLSLCGPSIERVNTLGDDTVYDIEITTNRPDSMSVIGIAREAAAILPRFNIPANFLNDPYKRNYQDFMQKFSSEGPKKLEILTDPGLNPRWTSIVIENIKMGPSPDWLAEKLEKSGIRPINVVVDVTNYLMRAYGQPAHAFDFDALPQKSGAVQMILRESAAGETLTTLDGKVHTLPGGDIVIADANGRLIDMCGIMGALNSAIKDSTKTVILFLQTYNPVRIRKTSMALGHRTEAAGLFEKDIDSELVMPAMEEGVKLLTTLTGGNVGSRLYDLYPEPFSAYDVSVTREKIAAYMGVALKDEDLRSYLEPLGFKLSLSPDRVTVTVPSFRRDITIDVDIIEEIARIYGYHELPVQLPDSAPPFVIPDPVLVWEENIKTRLRDWGYSELYTYSMISDTLMDLFSLDKTHTYKINNPLSNDWVYLRPHLLPSMLSAMKENSGVNHDQMLFELSMAYHYSPNSIPVEKSTLIIGATGQRFYELKGLAETIFTIFGIAMPVLVQTENQNISYYGNTKLGLGDFGSLGMVDQSLTQKLSINTEVTVLYLDFALLVSRANQVKKYQPIPKHPWVIEDFAFQVPDRFQVGPLLREILAISPVIAGVELLDRFKQTRTIRVKYQDPAKNLTSADTAPVRQKILELARKSFKIELKS